VRGGKIIAGKYRLEALVGTGAMGTVWSATHATLGSKVAVKLVSPDVARSPEAQARFMAEAKAAAALRSRYVVQMFDSGVTDDGSPYIVMEYLNGESLEERINRMGRVPLDQAVRIIGQVARGLQRAHASNIIHRDLKPANIYLALTDDGDEVAKILDFGIAKMDHDERDYKATATGVIMGTPLYMSPEQARGLRTVGRASDVYSLGMVAYCALVGDVPFRAESFGDLVYMVCTQDLPPTSETAPWLPEGIDAWFRRACNKDQNKRYQTAEEMYEALLVAADFSRKGGLASLPDTAQGFAYPRGLTPPHGLAMDKAGRPVAASPGGSDPAGQSASGRAHPGLGTLPLTDSARREEARSAEGFRSLEATTGSRMRSEPPGSNVASAGPRLSTGTREVESPAMQATMLDASQSGSYGQPGSAGKADWIGSKGTHDGGVVAPNAGVSSRRSPLAFAVAALGIVIAVVVWWTLRKPDATIELGIAAGPNVEGAASKAADGKSLEGKTPAGVAGSTGNDVKPSNDTAAIQVMPTPSNAAAGASSNLAPVVSATADPAANAGPGDEPSIASGKKAHGKSHGGHSAGAQAGKTPDKQPAGSKPTGAPGGIDLGF
jgi:serine/threonine-protein kinase